MTTFSEVFSALLGPHEGRATAVGAAFDAILAGEWTPVQVAGLAVSLRLLGESPEVIHAAAASLRRAMIEVDHGLPVVLDTCGTGGDGVGTWNLSTAAAFVVAACGVPVAKHGNRAVSSRSGSADVLEQLGVNLAVPPERQARLLREVGVAFLFAPAHHPAMKHGGIARRELGIRTLFNALGPLANPARATHQVLGAYDDALRPVLAETLRALGTTSAWIVRGVDGLDELSPCGATRVTSLRGGALTELVVSPEDFGLPRVPPAALLGEGPRENAQMIRDVLEGRPHPARAAVVLNAAAGLVVARELAPRDAAAEATRALDDGRAAELLSRFVAATASAS